jgi:ribonucleoside-diphosphate reductase alpha chain
VPHSESEQAVDDVLTGVIHEQIRRSLETLTERERTVLMLRFGLADAALIRDIELSGRIAHRDDLPESVRCLFRTASEIPAREHLAVQAAIQRHVENAVSKTLNLPETATAGEVREAFLLARRLGCKGVTIYREESRPRQALNVLGHCLTCVGEDVIPLGRG